MSQSVGELFPQLRLLLTNVITDIDLVMREHVAAIHQNIGVALYLQTVQLLQAQLSQSPLTLTEFEQRRRVPPDQPYAQRF